MKLDREKPKHETVMDVTAERISRVYAIAFMEVAAKTAGAASLVDELGSLVTEVLDRFPRFEETLRSALVQPEEKEQMLDRLFGKRASNEVVNFLKVLSRHGRLELLRPIARTLKQLHAERSGQKEVEVRVAIPLDDAVRTEIQNTLRKTLKVEPVIRVVVDPSLLAGMIIRVGDRVYDSSTSTQLEHARRQMIDRVVEKIETQPERFVVATA
ncbi:MAG TPA: ATP synthase F1 subunit delta [Lacipirellulaceae bacterium]